MNSSMKSFKLTKGKREKIIFLSAKNPLNKAHWSGIPFFMYHSLERHFEIQLIQGLEFRAVRKIGYYISQICEKTSGKKYAFDYGILLSFLYGIYYSLCLFRKKQVLFIFCPAGLTEIAFTYTKIPIISVGDCSTLQLIDYYPAMKNVLPISIKEIEWVEKKALARVTLQLFSSRWASDFTRKHYRISNVVEVPFGANIAAASSDENVISRKNKIPFQLIFISVDWYRKGGDIVLEIMELLIKMNRKVHLTIVGCKPPGNVDSNHVSVIEHLDKNTEGGAQFMEHLLSNSHLMLLPTKADCTPIVIAEAFAYGIPVLANDTGGLSSMIKNDVNGYLLDKSDAQCYVSKILEILDNPITYNRLALATLEVSKQTYNWNAWTHAGITAITDVLCKDKY